MELADFERDYDAQDIVFRNFQLAVQNCVDMAAHIAVNNSLPAPARMAEAFEILAERGWLGKPLTEDLRNLTALRNILVHDYTRIEAERAYPLIQKALVTIPQFCNAALKIS